MIKNYLLGFMALVVVVLFILICLDKCGNAIDEVEDITDVINYKDTVMYYKDKSDNLVAYNNALQITESAFFAANKELKAEVKELRLKNLSSVTTVKTEFVLDTLEILILDTLPCEEFLTVLQVDSPYYSLQATLSKRKLVFTDFRIPNEQSIMVGEKRNGLFKRNEFVVTINNSNPYMDVIGVQNYTFKKTIPLLKKWWLHSLLGIALGFFLNSTLSQ